MKRLKTTLQGLAMTAFLVVAIINAFNLDYGNAAVAFIAAVLVSM
jgi:hypothetical protein